MPDDDDEFNPGIELQLWRIRELKRIKRDRQERNQYDEDRAEMERRRNMTNEEIE
jgi:microfibrillar-associated protein 1